MGCRVPARFGAIPPRPHLPTPGRGSLSGLVGCARRGLEHAGSARQCTGGRASGRQWDFGGGDRSAPGVRSPLPGFGGRCQFWRALAQVKSAGVERQPRDDWRFGQFKRRTCHAIVRDAAARCALLCVHDLPEAPDLDATANYVVARSPISDPAARYAFAKDNERTALVANTEAYFSPWESISEGNPQAILDRKESVQLPPMIILQGDADDNVEPAVQERFAAAYRQAGGEIELEMFPGCDHRWIVNPGPETDRAIEVIKAFIARQLRALQPVS